jgi:signal transduction histidine kinase
MDFFSNLDLLSVGVAMAATGTLGFVVFNSNRKSRTNEIFLWFCIISIFWSIFNYFSYKSTDPNLTLLFLRLEIFFAVWWVLTLFFLLLVFPNEKFDMPAIIKYVLPAGILVSVLNLTPLVFVNVSSQRADGTVARVTNGPGIYLFGAFVISLIITSFFVLSRKMRAAKKNDKKQLRSVFYGMLATFTLLIIFNFILPAFYDNPSYIVYGAIFIFPFIVFTTYAIFKQHLLNIKVISTEVLVFVLSVVTIVEVVIAKDIITILFRVSEFLLVFSFGILLMRSVRREVEQREQLEVLTTQLEEANKQLKILDQARSEFITIASHQLRTPPATIKWYLASIIGGDFGVIPADAKEQLIKMEATNNSMIALIDDLLNVSRIERGKLEFIFMPTDMLEITKLTVDQLFPQAKTKNLQLIFNQPKTALPKVIADKEKLRQVINNFIDNAIKYTKEGKVVVDLSKTATDVVLKVTDTGKGVTEVQKKSIFEKFDRGKEAAKNSSGLGLGLYVAKVIIEQHKGKIWVESKGEGKGSTFCFSIPLKSDLKAETFDLTKDQKVITG